MPRPTQSMPLRAAATLAAAACLLALPAAAQGVEAARFPLAEVLRGATAISFVPPGTLFAATGEAAYFCVYSILPEFLEAIATDRTAEVPRPEGTCVDIRIFDIHEG